MNPKYYSHIAYFIHVDTNSQLSPFNHYYNEHIKNRHIVSQIMSLPKDIVEIYTSKENLINWRMTGIIDGYDIRYISDICLLYTSPSPRD